MFFKAAQRGNNNVLLYLLMVIIIIVSQGIGSIPLVLEVFKYPEVVSSGDMTKVLGVIPNKNYALILVALPFVVTSLFFVLLSKPLYKKSIKDWVTGAPKFRWNQFLFAFGIGALVVIVSTLFSYFMAPDDFEFHFNLQSFLIMMVIVIFFITIQACTEELIFRGWLTQGIGLLTKSRLLALLVPSILFGMLHLSNPEVAEHGVAKMLPMYITMGLAFGVMTLMNDGTELAMGYHAANNIVLSLLVTSPESVLQTNALLQMKTAQDIDGQLVPMIISEIIIIAIFAWKYKWTDWKGKLFGTIHNDRREFLV